MLSWCWQIRLHLCKIGQFEVKYILEDLKLELLAPTLGLKDCCKPPQRYSKEFSLVCSSSHVFWKNSISKISCVHKFMYLMICNCNYSFEWKWPIFSLECTTVHYTFYHFILLLMKEKTSTITRTLNALLGFSSFLFCYGWIYCVFFFWLLECHLTCLKKILRFEFFLILSRDTKKSQDPVMWQWLE